MIRNILMLSFVILGFLSIASAENNPVLSLTLKQWDMMDQDDKSYLAEGYGTDYANVEIFEYSFNPDQDLQSVVLNPV